MTYVNLAFKKGAMDIVGIDIGTVSVKYVRWKGKKDKGEIVSYGDYLYGGNPSDLGTIITDIAIKEGTDVEVSVGITSQEIEKKTYTIPIIPRNELKDAANWAASKLVNIPLDDMNYENLVLGEVDERGSRKNEILFVGARKDYIQNILTIFGKAGLKRVISVTDSGISCLPFIENKVPGSFAVIDIGGRRTGIYIFDDGHLKFMREIMTASESFTDALMSGFNLSYNEAEARKQKDGFNEETMAILAVPLERLGSEIQRTLNVYLQRYPGKRIDNVYVTGRVTSIPNLVAKIQDYIFERVERLTTGMRLENEYLPAYFLARYADSLINIMPQEAKSRKSDVRIFRWAMASSVAAAVVLLILSLVMIYVANKNKTLAEQERTRLMKARQQLAGFSVDPKAARYESVLALKGEIQKKDITVPFFLRYLSSNLPKNLYLKELSLDKTAKSEAETKPATPQQSLPGQQQSAPVQDEVKGKTVTPDAREYALVLSGYYFGEPNGLELALLDFTGRLEKAGYLRDVVITRKDTGKDLKNLKMIEFSLKAWCQAYEI